MAEFKLDTLVTTFTGDSSEYEAVLAQVRASNQEFLKDLSNLQKSMREAFTGDFGAAFKQAWEAIGREAERGGQRVKPAANSITKDLQLINREVGLAAAQFRAGVGGTDSFGAALDKATYSLKELQQMGQLTRAETIALERALLNTEKGYQSLASASDDTGLSTEHLKNLVHELRHATEADTMTRQESIEAFRRVREEALAEAAALESGTKSKRDLTGVAATAARSIKTLEGNLTTLGLSGNVAVAMSNTLQGRLSAISDEAKEVQAAIAPLTGGARGGGILGLIMGGAQAFGAASLARTGIAGAMGLEDFLVTLRTISTEGQRIFDELYEASDRLPATWNELMRGTQALTGYGVAADDVVPVLENLSTISTALGGSLDSMVNTYGRVRAAGRVSMLEINSLTAQGVPIFRALAAQLGVAETEVRSLVSSGVVGFEDFAAAMSGMTEAGGQFFGLLDELERTTSGKLRRLADGFSIVTDTIGTNLVPAYNRAIDAAQGLVSRFNDLDEGTQNIIVRFGVAATAASTMGTLTLALGANIGRVTAAFTAMRAVMLASPWGWVALGVGALGGLATWLITARQRVDELQAAQDRLKDASGRMRTGLLDAVDAVGQLQDATSLQGLRGSVQSLAAGMNEEGRNAFIAYAEQAILTSNDVEAAGNKIIAKWAEIQQAAVGADLALAQSTVRELEAMAQARWQAANAETVGFDNRTAMYADRIADAFERQKEAAMRFSTGLIDEATFREINTGLVTNIETWQAAQAAVDAYAGTIERVDPDLSDLDLDGARAIVAGLQEQFDNYGRIIEAPSEATDILTASIGVLGGTTTDTDKDLDTFGKTVRTVNDVIADLSKNIDTAATRARHNLASGMTEAATKSQQLEDELRATQSAYESLLTGDFAVPASDELLLSLRNQIASLASELEISIPVRLEPVDPFAPDHLDGWASIPDFQPFGNPQERERLLAAGLADLERAAAATVAHLEREAERQERIQENHLQRLRASYEAHYADQERRARAAAIGVANAVGSAAGSLEGNLLGIEQAEVDRVAAYAVELERLAQIAARAATFARPDEGGSGTELEAVYVGLRAAIRAVDLEASVFGETAETLSRRIQIQRAAVLDLAREYGAQSDEVARAQGELELYEAALVRFGKTFSGVKHQIEGADFGIKAVFDPSAFNAATASVKDWLGTAPTQWDEMRKAIEDARRHMAELGVTTEELDDALRTIGLMELEESFRSMASSVGGLGGDILNLVADFGKAIVQYQVTGDKLGLVTAGFNAARAAVDAFKSAFSDGFDGNELVSGLTGIGSGIATLIGGPAMGEAFAAIGGFVQSILGDLSNGLKQIREQVDGIAGSSRYASRELVQAFADMNTSMESRGGLAGLFGGKKAVIDEVEVKRLTGIAENVASGLAQAFGAVDLTAFREAFNLGIDELIQEQIIAGFIDSTQVQNALKRITLALDSDDFAGARREYDKLRDSAEAIYEQTQRWSREMRNARGYAQEIQAATRATQDLLASAATSQLERAFATGAMGLQEYAAALAALSDSDVTRDFTRQMDDLKAVRDEALAEGADPAYIRALDEQIRALSSSWREALEQGTHEAAEAVKQILGTSIGDVQGLFRSAFDSSTFDDFLGSFGNNLRMTTRNALTTAFLEGAVIKPLMDELSNAITDAVIDGMITEAELEGILTIGDEITGEMEWFFDLLEELGLGFDALTDDVNAATAAMSNVPTVWKGTLAEWNAATPTTQGGYSTASVSGMLADAAGSYTTEVHVHGDVYNMDDFEKKVIRAVDSTNDQRNLRRTGV